jgi:hypothetical protein
MNSIPQQAVTNGKGKNEYFLPQLMTLLSFVVMALVPNIVSSPIWAPFFHSKCCARLMTPPVWRGISLTSHVRMSVDNVSLVGKPPQGVSTPNGKRMRYLWAKAKRSRAGNI